MYSKQDIIEVFKTYLTTLTVENDEELSVAEIIGNSLTEVECHEYLDHYADEEDCKEILGDLYPVCIEALKELAANADSIKIERTSLHYGDPSVGFDCGEAFLEDDGEYTSKGSYPISGLFDFCISEDCPLTKSEFVCKEESFEYHGII